jgi:transposase
MAAGSAKIRTVAIESTGNDWLTACAVLEDAGIEVCLVDARHVKGVPGKKTDVCDAAWLQQLHAASCCGQASVHGAKSFHCDTSCANGPIWSPRPKSQWLGREL